MSLRQVNEHRETGRWRSAPGWNSSRWGRPFAFIAAIAECVNSRWPSDSLPGLMLRLIDWQMALSAAVLTPVVVLLHELAHVLAFEAGGIDAHLRAFSMGMPVRFSWDFQGLEAAASFYGVNGRTIAYGALAGPITTLLIALGAWLAYHFRHARVLWAGALCALALRMVGITEFMPRYLDGSMNSSDEAIAAHFLSLPLSSVYWLSLALGYACILLLYTAVERGHRFSASLSAMLGGVAGYFAVDTLANLIIFKPDVWGR